MQTPVACQDLQAQADVVLHLLAQEPPLRNLDTTSFKSSIKKATAPRFEIVFAGAFSAGKSMLINALLGQELLYSAEGHATGTACEIYYAESTEQEKIELNFMSVAEIKELVNIIAHELELNQVDNINSEQETTRLIKKSGEIIASEGGENRSERAKQALTLKLLVQGFIENRDRIDAVKNTSYSMEQLAFSNLQEATKFARRGSNSSVLKKIKYYCHDPLLQDGNVIVDTPGIDAPVPKDAETTFSRIEDPDTSAVICVLKPAASGELTSPETRLLEHVRSNPGIRDRVFYIFNRIDETWYNAQLRQKLEKLLSTDFPDSSRVYQTSGLLGFYGCLIKNTSITDRFGLDSVFTESVKTEGGKEEIPQFVYAFNNYCSSSGKLPSSFRIDIKSYESPNENYVRILREWGNPLINQLITDSGIDTFKAGITRYLREEKRPLLYVNLADDLQPICIAMRRYYIDRYHYFDNQPQELEAMKSQELAKLSQDLHQLGEEFFDHICIELNQAVASNTNKTYEHDFTTLQSRMVARLDELISNLSVAEIHRLAQASHRRNSVVPVMGILVEAFYYLANELETILVESSKTLVEKFFTSLIARVGTKSYYSSLYRLLGNDGGIQDHLLNVQNKVLGALMSEAKTECDRYVRERPEFYVDGNVSIWQLRQTLQQACRGYDFKSMVDAEPAIKQLLKLDFEQKVKETVVRTFRQTINQTLNDYLLEGAKQQSDQILQQYDQARSYLEITLEKESVEKIRSNQLEQKGLLEKISSYNNAIGSINQCLESMQLDRKKLPLITDADLIPLGNISLSNTTEDKVDE